MPETSTGQVSGREGGFFPHSLGFLAAALAYLNARLQLAGIECREAGTHYVGLLALVAAAIGSVVCGYFFACLGLVFLLAWALGEGHSWIWVTLGLGVLHLLAAVSLLWLAKSRLSSPVFAATFNEFKKDQEWLNSKTPSPCQKPH